MKSDDQEMISVIYIALACAAGGRDLLDRSNDILRTAVDTNRISRPETKRAIKVLLALTEGDDRAACSGARRANAPKKPPDAPGVSASEMADVTHSFPT